MARVEDEGALCEKTVAERNELEQKRFSLEEKRLSIDQKRD